MNDPNREGLLQEVALRLIGTYGFVIKVLQGLPVPIQVSAVVTDRFDLEIGRDLVRALDLLADIPMDATYREQVRGLVIDWLTAADYLADAREDFEFWKVDFVATQLYRVKGRWETIQGMRDTLE